MNWRVTLALLVLGTALTAQVMTIDITPIDFPGATQSYALGINNAGDIVGQFTEAKGVVHGFLLRGGQFTQLDFPGSVLTSAWDINSRGDIVGRYNDGKRNYGFLLSGGKYTTLDCTASLPAGASVLSLGATGINSAGDIVGLRSIGYVQGVIWRGGACTVVDYRPESGSLGNTRFYRINDAGVIVGSWAIRETYFALVYDKGKFTSRFVQNAGGWTEAYGINNAGEIIGIQEDAARWGISFLLSNGRFTQFRFPGMIWSNALAINDSREIVGEILDGQRKIHGFYARVAPAGPAPPTLTVDDDGAECPGALTTIQEAINRAPAGATIQVCPGNYWGTVTIRGPEKAGLKLIAVGNEDEVVLRGDYTERNGFHLENVTNVLIRGLTVRDFGDKPTTADQWGVGNLVYLHDAHYNRIEQNRLINGDQTGIMLVDSGYNQIRNNLRWLNLNLFAGTGIHVQGAKSAGNTISLNMLYNNKLAGITIRNAGPGNVVSDNTVLSNGRYGIQVEATSDIWIEGNRVSYGRGFWGDAMPGGQQAALGISLVGVNKATVLDNRARANSGVDLSWDGKGENRLELNACETSTPAGICVR